VDNYIIALLDTFKMIFLNLYTVYKQWT